MAKAEVMIPVVAAYLHKAIMIAGKTESTITRDKIPQIKIMGWTKNDLFLIDTGHKQHLFGSANVADSILE